jgi:hypothetical protein
MPACTALLKRGPNQGHPCGRPTSSDFCTRHSQAGERAVKPTCTVLIQRGPRANTACGKSCAIDSDVCRVHMKAKLKENRPRCSTLLKRGAHKDQPCGKPCLPGVDTCRTHSKLEVSRPCPAILIRGRKGTCGKQCVKGADTCSNHAKQRTILTQPCIFPLKRGPRAANGGKCDRPSKDGLCSKHYLRADRMEVRCDFVKGGRVCGKVGVRDPSSTLPSFCAQHNKPQFHILHFCEQYEGSDLQRGLCLFMSTHFTPKQLIGLLKDDATFGQYYEQMTTSEQEVYKHPTKYGLQLLAKFASRYISIYYQE